MNNVSPCRKVCKLSKDNICIGCYRTLDEIANWNSMTLREQLKILRRVKHDFMAGTELSPAEPMERMEGG